MLVGVVVVFVDGGVDLPCDVAAAETVEKLGQGVPPSEVLSAPRRRRLRFLSPGCG